MAGLEAAVCRLVLGRRPPRGSFRPFLGRFAASPQAVSAGRPAMPAPLRSLLALAPALPHSRLLFSQPRRCPCAADERVGSQIWSPPPSSTLTPVALTKYLAAVRALPPPELDAGKSQVRPIPAKIFRAILRGKRLCARLFSSHLFGHSRGIPCRHGISTAVSRRKRPRHVFKNRSRLTRPRFSLRRSRRDRRNGGGLRPLGARKIRRTRRRRRTLSSSQRPR